MDQKQIHPKVIHWGLAVLLLTAFFVRYQGIPFGFPLMTHPNEPFIVNTAMNMVHSGDLNPHFFLNPKRFYYHFFMYPSFYIYCQYFIFSTLIKILEPIYIARQIATIDLPTFLFWGRMLTVLFSVGTIYCVYLIGKRLWTPVVGFLAALFLSFSWMHIEHAFSITVDTPMTFWLSLSFFMSVLIYSNGTKPQFYILNGLFMGFAIGTKYTAFVGILPLVIAHIVRTYNGTLSFKNIINRNILYGLFLIPIAFFVTTPFALVEFPGFLDSLRHLKNAWSSPVSVTNAWGGISGYYLQTFAQRYGMISLIFAALGVFLLWTKDRLKAAFLCAVPLFSYIFFASYKAFHSYALFSLLPFLALLSGYGAYAGYEKLKNIPQRRYVRLLQIILRFLLIGAIVSGISHQAWVSWNNVKISTLPDSRVLAHQWLEKHLPDKATIARDHFLEDRSQNKFYVHRLPLFLFEFELIDQYDYVITSSYEYDRYFQNR